MKLWRGFFKVLFWVTLGNLLSVNGLAMPSQPLSQTLQIDGLRVRSQGPNCWNGALIKTGLVNAVRFVPKAEYWFWMHSQYCRELKPSETPRSGDLGSLFWNGLGHYHSFIYRDAENVFSKNGPNPIYDYKVQRFEGMFDAVYQTRARECWQAYKNKKNISCEFKLKFHRCNSLEKSFYQDERDVALLDHRIQPLESQVYAWVTGVSPPSKGSYRKTIQSLYGILREVQKLQAIPMARSKWFKIEALEYRLLGLLLADTKVSAQIPDVFPIIDYAYKRQSMKKNTSVEASRVAVHISAQTSSDGVAKAQGF